MGSTSRKKGGHKGITLLGTVALCVVVICVMVMNSSYRQRLSASEISALRDEYPICGDVNLFHGSMRTPTLSEVKENVDTFIYGVIEGEVSTYSRSLSTGNVELDVKRRENGIEDTFEFYEYTISVIKDTKGIYRSGDKISISSSKEFADLNPVLKEGMEVVVPTTVDKEKSDRSYYGVFGMYYVTRDKYAISAFDESKMMKEAMSGIKVEQLMSELKK